MSVAFIADLHLTNPKKFGGAKRLGVNERCKLILRTLERAYKIASGAGATSLFILGDFFDSGSPGPRIIAAGQAVIVEAQEKYGISTVIMPGNHDLFSSETGDHTLGPLRPVAQVVDGPTQV
jgi:metallophosphoesterase superfamily enzyme